MKAAELKKLRSQLEEKRRELVDAYRRSQEAQRQPGDEGLLDLADRATEHYAKEFQYSLSDKDRELVRHVEEALQRMEEGSYGECQECGEAIAERRLKAIPWAQYCLDCQEKREARERTG